MLIANRDWTRISISNRESRFTIALRAFAQPASRQFLVWIDCEHLPVRRVERDRAVEGQACGCGVAGLQLRVSQGAEHADVLRTFGERALQPGQRARSVVQRERERADRARRRWRRCDRRGGATRIP